MKIKKHIDAKELAAWKSDVVTTSGVIVFLVVFFLVITKGTVFSLVVLLAACIGSAFFIDRTVAPYRRFKEVMAVLKEHPDYTFTQIATALEENPKMVQDTFAAAIRQGVLVRVKIDKDADCLKSIPRPPRRPVRVESFLTVSCPNCGAACEVSSVYGGQCEYCDSWLPGTE